MTRIYSVLSLIALSFGLTACVTGPEQIVGPDGTINQLISCMTMEQCYSDASRACGGPYKIINTTPDTSGDHGQTTTTYQMLIKCGK